jgi:hypothetical protein
MTRRGNLAKVEIHEVSRSFTTHLDAARSGEKLTTLTDWRHGILDKSLLKVRIFVHIRHENCCMFSQIDSESVAGPATNDLDDVERYASQEIFQDRANTNSMTFQSFLANLVESDREAFEEGGLCEGNQSSNVVSIGI